MISFKCVVFILYAVLVRGKSINKPYGITEFKTCENIALAVNSLETLNDANLRNFYDCSADDNDICVACEDMVFNLRNTFAEIFNIDEFNSICQAYGVRMLSSQCELIEEHCLHDFILLLNSKITSSAICASMQSSNATITALLNANDENIKCKICEEVVQHLKTFLTTKSTKTGILNVLKTICDLTSGTLKKECVYYTHKYYEYVYKFIDGLDPKDICSVFGFYVSQVKETFLTENFKNSVTTSISNELCSACKFLVKFIQKGLSNHHTVEDVKSALKHVCKLVPNKYKARECELYAMEFADLIIGILAVEADPSLVCPMINLCAVDTSAENISIKYGDADTNEIMLENNEVINAKSISDLDISYTKEYNENKDIADVIEKQIGYMLQAVCFYFYTDEDQRKCYEAFLN